ncbi:MAG: beta-lactamase family protein [Acidobacteria bacterium]|nr:beta-lactamase family protein [Acidobacteriota bacterium]
MKHPVSLLFIATFFLAASAAIAQAPDISELSKLEGGRRVIEYFEAFNSGDEQRLKQFFEQNLTAESLSARPVAPRLDFHRQIRHDHRALTVEQVVSIETKQDVEVSLMARGATGTWLSFKFRFERQSPQKLIGWQIQMSNAPSSVPKSNSRAPSAAEFPAALARYLDDLVADDRFSGVVLVAKGPGPIFRKAFGLADQETKRANDIETKFNLGSINKVFTQIAIGQLLEQKKISIDDKLGKFLPDYPNSEAREKVTIRHLLTMTSGIGDMFGSKFESTPKKKLRSIKDFIPLFADQALAFEPGTRNQYSNGGYVLLGAIIEKISGISYYEYVRKNIFEPVGMNNTDSFESDRKTPNMAEGYTTLGVADGAARKRRNNLDTRPARGSSAGGGYSTADDLLKFSLALQSGKLRLPNTSGDDPRAPGKFGGFGFAGGSPGVNGMIEIIAEGGYTVIVLSNYDPPSAENIGDQIKSWLEDLKKK